MFRANLFRANGIRRPAAIHVAALLCLAFGSLPAAAQSPTALADQPIFTATVPGNLALVLSVEYPTATSVANIGNYSDTSTYYGYFDPLKCYNYVYNATTPNQSFFQPAAFGGSASKHQCSGMWSGNFMNWATMPTIDPFRWALTGGFRSTDQTTYPQTVLEKAWASNQGQVYGSALNAAIGEYPYASAEFPYRGTDQNNANGDLANNLVSKVTPFSTWANFNSAIFANGNTMVFSGTYNGTQATGYYTAYSGTTSAGNNGTVTGTATANASVYDLTNNLTGVNIPSQPVTFRVYVRVSVCDTSILGIAGLESNCKQYGSSTYKPEGLLQKYSNQMRYAALSYLGGSGYYQQGGVLREPMGYIGPTYTLPLSATVITNPLAEWSAVNGIQITNPDTAAASGSGVSQSGVIEYLNRFGEYNATVVNGGNTNINTDTYISGDNLSELYYAAIRYYENMANVPQWSTPQTEPAPLTTAIQYDGFPAVSNFAWTTNASAPGAPILYSCQKNFILGIADDHTHFDYNVGGQGPITPPYALPVRPLPAAVAADTFNQAYTWTEALQKLEGITQTPWWTYVSGNAQDDSTYFIAGLAYGAHVLDIRPDLAGTQTISTYWVDVEEYGYPDNLNPAYLAAKYGGFAVPTGYSIANTTPLTLGWWDTTSNACGTPSCIEMGPNLNQLQYLPDNYFPAGNAGLMVSSLNSAFASISNAIQAFTTAFSFSQTTVATSGVESFAAQYNAANWTGVITASNLVFNSDGSVNTAATTTLWTTSTTLQNQLAGNGWSTGRHIVTWNGTAGIPFEAANLTAAQTAALATVSTYSPSTTAAQYLNYLRGDQTNEVGSTAAGGSRSLRARTLFLGDIVDASLTPVATPSQIFSQANNPGYPAFQAMYSTRPTVVYAAANDGMLHAFLGASGVEQFAYIPSAVFAGPSATPQPQVNGLAALGNPNFAHHYYVDATPLAFDLDMAHTGGTTGTPSWSTLLIGGLGKGGNSYYAIDVTNPAAMNTEAAIVSNRNVKWEFTDQTMGYSYGAPIVVKTARYGWVVVLTSGYDNSDGYGHIYIVNPATGALIQNIATPTPSIGLTQASAYVKDYSDDTADSVYVGDLNGQLWRFDLTALTTPYPQPARPLAVLKDGSGNAQPITTAPLIEISPVNLYRYVLVGTGQLLSSADVTSANGQTFYAIIDGTEGSFNPLPATSIGRANLVAVTNSTVTTGVTVPTSMSGWYLDLGLGSTNIAWRVVTNPVAYDGIVAFSALLPSGTPCNTLGQNSSGGQSEVYAINFGTATSVITNTQAGATTPLPYVSVSSAVTNLKFFNNANSTTSTNGAQLEAGTSGGNELVIPTTPTGGIGTRLLNWREIPTAE